MIKNNLLLLSISQDCLRINLSIAIVDVWRPLKKHILLWIIGGEGGFGCLLREATEGPCCTAHLNYRPYPYILFVPGLDRLEDCSFLCTAPRPALSPYVKTGLNRRSTCCVGAEGSSPRYCFSATSPNTLRSMMPNHLERVLLYHTTFLTLLFWPNPVLLSRLLRSLSCCALLVFFVSPNVLIRSSCTQTLAPDSLNRSRRHATGCLKSMLPLKVEERERKKKGLGTDLQNEWFRYR